MCFAAGYYSTVRVSTVQYGTVRVSSIWRLSILIIKCVSFRVILSFFFLFYYSRELEIFVEDVDKVLLNYFSLSTSLHSTEKNSIGE